MPSENLVTSSIVITLRPVDCKLVTLVKGNFYKFLEALICGTNTNTNTNININTNANININTNANTKFLLLLCEK